MFSSKLLPILNNTPVEAFVHQPSQDYKSLPSIYAVEVTASCNLACPMCLRTTDMVDKKPRLLDFKLLELMARRGDFTGSSYIELQMAGEPTIHPQLHKIIRFLQQEVGVLVGLSTHGQNMVRPAKIEMSDIQTIAEVLLQLDSLTISVDSMDEATYAQMRYPATLTDLISNLKFFFNWCGEYRQMGRHLPFIELQLVNTPLAIKSGDVGRLEEVMQLMNWVPFASIRTAADCFIEMQGREPAGSRPRNSPICINPFTTVNVSQDGDVVSCCFIFEQNKHEINYYGNLWEQSLADIWNSQRVKNMQMSQISGQLQDQCTKCYHKSPILIHDNIISRLVRSRKVTK